MTLSLDVADTKPTPQTSPHSRSSAALASVAASLRPAGLEAVMSAANLQTRTDHKYLVTPEQFTAFAELTAGRFHALDIAGRRTFGYESTYFDTADLALFRGHRQGRRRRYKVRTRSYLDSGECLFEVKFKGRRGQTVKKRMPYDLARRDRIDDRARMFAAAELDAEYAIPVPQLMPVLTTRYRRSTFADLADGARLTCDVDLACTDPIGDPGLCRADTLLADAGRSRLGPDQILVESKSGGGALADRAFATLGIRPVGISKYCVGVALLDPRLAANRWDRLLRREFGWQRELGTTERPARGSLEV